MTGQRVGVVTSGGPGGGTQLEPGLLLGPVPDRDLVRVLLVRDGEFEEQTVCTEYAAAVMPATAAPWQETYLLMESVAHMYREGQP